jgi:hypothetical protein
MDAQLVSKKIVRQKDKPDLPGQHIFPPLLPYSNQWRALSQCMFDTEKLAGKAS